MITKYPDPAQPKSSATEEAWEQDTATHLPVCDIYQSTYLSHLSVFLGHLKNNALDPYIFFQCMAFLSFFRDFYGAEVF